MLITDTAYQYRSDFLEWFIPAYWFYKMVDQNDQFFSLI